MKKIPTIFKRNLNKMSELLPEPHPDCAWVFDGEGVATQKYDGTCCKIDASGFWRRRTVKKGKSYPSSVFYLVETDENTGKRFGWEYINPLDSANKYHMEAYRHGLEFGTYELCGPKIHGNPENINEHILIRHKDWATGIYINVPRSFEGLRDFLKDKDIEGIVFHHPDGRMAKIKKRDFGQKRTT